VLMQILQHVEGEGSALVGLLVEKAQRGDFKGLSI
jgi:hypothetical protein